jgi:glycosyltransferase involved in cell wall biosynthesis/peptidoglycan/xylan/chitin deacetylase (PgdA/CDA1 family)
VGIGQRAVMANQPQVPLGALPGQHDWWAGEDERVEAALVSVVIPCYNQAHFLAEAIESVLAQSYPRVEIVVVDDGSPDNTREVAARYPEVRYVRQENQGLAAARNTGLRHSRGEYLVFLDADDRLLPEAVEAGLRQLRTHPECAFTFGKWKSIAANGSPLARTPPPPFAVQGDPYIFLLQCNHIQMHATVLYRRSVFEVVGVFDPSLNASEDYDLYLRITRQYPVCAHATIVAEYRRHGSNMTHDPARMLRTSVTVLRRQRQHVQSDARRAAAYRAGLRFWYGCYGGQLVAQVLKLAAEGDWRQALDGLSVLLRDPLLLPQAAIAGLWRQRRPVQMLLTRRTRGLITFFGRLRATPGISPKLQVHPRLGRGVAGRQRELPPNGLILLYHSVACSPTDPWALHVTPEHFAEHLQILQSYSHNASLPELLETLQDREVPGPLVAVTFDDGYANNLHAAKPLLERFQVPATVFVAVGSLENPGELWWDELDGILMQPGTLPDSLQIQVNGRRFIWNLGDAAHYTEKTYRRFRSWRAWKNPPGPRQALYRSLWGLLHRLPVGEREQVLDELRAWAGTANICRPTHRCLSRAEALALADGPWVTLGAHTVSHPSLSTLSVDAQQNEIEESRSRLVELLGHPITSFAYPFGKRSDYSEETMAIVRQAGFTSACTSVHGVVGPSTDRFQLLRLHVHDWDGATFSRRLSAHFKT